MKLKHYPVEKLKKEIIEIAGKYLDLKKYQLFFFGSRVRGDNFLRADIDIGIKGRKKVPIPIKMEIKERLEKIRTLYKFDFVDFADVSKKFKKQALKNIEKI